MKNHSSSGHHLDISIIGLMSALVFVGTYFFKIPSAFGYTHLGDCMIILTVCLFGTRRGVLAGAIGAGLSDFLGGYAVWVLPTMLLKGLWAFIAGTIAYKLLPNFKVFLALSGAIVGGIAHIIGYTLVKIPLYGTVVAFGEMFTLSMQTIAGIVLRRRGLHDPCTVPGDPNIKGKICVTKLPVRNVHALQTGVFMGLYKFFYRRKSPKSLLIISS